MGFFDWLFGRKKDAYGGGFKKDYAAPREVPQQAWGGPVRPPQEVRERRRAELRSAAADAPILDRSGLVQRRARSRQQVAKVALQSIRGELWSRKASKHAKPAQVRDLGLPSIEHIDELAALLNTARNDLLQYLARDHERLSSHYIRRELPKKAGGTRVLYAPKPRLKALQRALLEKLVRKLPLNEAVHGFRRGRDARSGATVHVDRDVVICLDIAEFFPSFDFRRVSGFFRSLGYSREVGVALANLTTVRQESKASPYAAWRPRLPQGAPTSPGIANAICWRMDKRLAALARRFGGEYTRYADDLTFSGGAEMLKGAGRLVALVRKIVKTEGLELNEAKTRVMRSHTQQRVTGVVVNKQTNVARREYDRLKAILHNCIKHGPVSQNREQHPNFAEHLRGRIAHITHIGPKRGRKLKAMFDQINW
jgi:hypothetical protein